MKPQFASGPLVLAAPTIAMVILAFAKLKQLLHETVVSVKRMPDLTNEHPRVEARAIGSDGLLVVDPRIDLNDRYRQSCFTMTRAASPEQRAELLEKVVDYILKHGLVDLSLRPLAAALRTSPRMLLYFFGSKEQLLAEALTTGRARQRREFARALSTRSSREEELRLAWEVWSSKESKKSTWMFFEAFALAMRDRKRFPGFLERLVKDWLPFFEQAVAAAGVEAERVQPVATFILATLRGLQLDVLATNEQVRVDGAFRELVRLLAVRPGTPLSKSPQPSSAKNPQPSSQSVARRSIPKPHRHLPKKR
jgi:AcrR family transcriptional regulator